MCFHRICKQWRIKLANYYVIEGVVTKVQKCLCGCNFWISGTEGFSVNIKNQNKNSVKYNLLIQNEDFNITNKSELITEMVSINNGFNSTGLNLILLSNAMSAGKKCQIKFKLEDSKTFNTKKLTIQSITICSE